MQDAKFDRQTPQQNTRNTNIEWLRIISMLLIIAYHAGYQSIDQPFIMYSSGVVFGSWGLLGVDLFLIISAWFLSSQQFRVKKIIHIVFQTFTWVLGYSVLYVIYDCFYCHNGVVATLIDFCKYSLEGFFQPLWCNYYWFITTYFFMLLLSPFLNKILNVLNKSQIQKLLLVFLFVPIYAQFGRSAVCDVFRFLYVYLLIGYIKKYGSLIIEKYAKPRFYIFLIALVLLSKFVCYFFSGENSISKFTSMIIIILNNTFAKTGRHSIILLLISMLIFFHVLNKKPTFNNKVNKIASYCLGVYLFHENVVLGLPRTIGIIFGKLTSLGFLTADVLFPVKYAGIVVCVFIIGILCEWIRDCILQKPFMKYVSTKWTQKISRVDKWFNNF